MFKSFILAVASISFQQYSEGRTIPSDSLELVNDELSIVPAAAAVEATEANSGGGGLFPSEKLQLTDDITVSLTASTVRNGSLFDFQSKNNLDSRTIYDSFGKCKTYPGDPLWPLKTLWEIFDLLLGGALVETVPYAAPCYDDFGPYDETQCNFITSNWFNGSIYQTDDPTAISANIFQGMTCIPPGIESSKNECTLGGYPAYSVAATNVAQVQLAANLARNLNLRLVIKNTGHDLAAKSAGMGALSIWTHHFKDIQFFESYEGDDYSGPAMKLGSGVQEFELYEAADRYNVTVVAGNGYTVGSMGGYILGGGHSRLSSMYGMAADQIISLNVVTANGRFVTASPSSHPDLFWALRGGGGSTFGVVTSIVIKVFPRMRISTINWVLNTGMNVSTQQFWEAWHAVFKQLPAYTGVGHHLFFTISNSGGGQFASNMGPWFAPEMTKSELEDFTSPLFSEFQALAVDVNPVFKEYDRYYDSWSGDLPAGGWGGTNTRIGSRIFPKCIWENPDKLNTTFQAIKGIVEDGGIWLGTAIEPAGKVGFPDTAVNPAWRETVHFAIIATQWDPNEPESGKKEKSDRLTFDWMARLRELSPGGGAYLSESDYIEPGFTQSFWSSKYPRLYELKQHYDPLGVFYAHQAVGSEDWHMTKMIFGNLPSQNSKLCRI